MAETSDPNKTQTQLNYKVLVLHVLSYFLQFNDFINKLIESYMGSMDDKTERNNFRLICALIHHFLYYLLYLDKFTLPVYFEFALHDTLQFRSRVQNFSLN